MVTNKDRVSKEWKSAYKDMLEGLKSGETTEEVTLGESAIPYLIEAYSEDDKTICDNATEALVRIGMPAALELLRVRRTFEYTINVTDKMRFPLAGMGKDIIPLLAEEIKSDDWLSQWKAFQVLRMIGKPALPAIIETFKDPSTSNRYRFIEEMEEMADPGCLQVFIEALADHEEDVRRCARRAMQTMASIKEVSLHDVAESLKRFVARETMEGGVIAGDKARTEATEIYIYLFREIWKGKKRSVHEWDGRLSEGTIRPPKGANDNGMFRTNRTVVR